MGALLTYQNKGGTRRPRTLLEALFEGLDYAARAIARWMPLGTRIKEVVSSAGEELIDWDGVRDVAYAVLDAQKTLPGPISPEMIGQYQLMLEGANREVERYTRLHPQDLPGKVHVFSQKDWIEANIPSFRYMFEPISENYEAHLKEPGAIPGYAGKLAHGFLTVQVGILIGYLARSVLGQFDLSLPEPEGETKLYVVEPNIRRVELELGLEPREFRQWITLHEATHSYEFHSSPWLKGYLSSNLREYMKSISWRLVSRPEILRNIRESRPLPEEGELGASLIAMISTPEQREILSRLHAVMCVLEGYSNHVMDAVGGELLSTYAYMKEKFERRRQTKKGAERLLQRMLGVNLKLEQYRLGERFVNEVVKLKGIGFMNVVWQGPEMLPSLAEIRRPEKWIERVEGAQEHAQA